MGNIAISSNRSNMYTNISNDFIDKYIGTDGTNFKVYVYLLSLTQQNITISSLETIEIVLGIDSFALESALLYWQSEGLISISLDNNEHITGIVINDVKNDSPKRRSFTTKSINSVTSATNNQNKNSASPDAERGGTAAYNSYQRTSLTSADSSEDLQKQKQYDDIKNIAIKALMPEQDSIKEVMFYAEKYLDVQVNDSNRERLISIYNHLYGNVALVEHLLIYGAEHNKKNLRYLERIAVDWNHNHIRNSEDADNYLKNFTDYYGRVIRAFGIRNRDLNDDELDEINKWYDMFHTNSDLIIEACNRTMRRCHEPSFGYTYKILKGWYDNNVSTMDDVLKLDMEHKNEMNKQYARYNNPKKAPASSFNYENQRNNIDFDKLEEELIAPKKFNSDN